MPTTNNLEKSPRQCSNSGPKKAKQLCKPLATTNSHEAVLHPCLYFNCNTANLADKDKSPDTRRHREQTRSLVVKDMEKYTRAQGWDNAVRALGNGKTNFKIVRGDRIKKIPYSHVVVMKAEDDAKKMDNTVVRKNKNTYTQNTKTKNQYQFPASNSTFTFVRKLVRKPDGTYRNREYCKHCLMDHLHQNCPTHKKEVEEHLKRLG
ncbi:hypothetical protein BDR26DRAFT_896234 [Obelidium mucronatum]|nr:hypothetical protein BDR26DRAFT_896234 [Obelidium mucronatum]